MSDDEFAKIPLHQLTSRHGLNPTGSHIYWPNRTLHHYSQGNSYALTAVCSLKGYLMTIPLLDKKTVAVAIHLFLQIMLKFSFPRILHSYSGTKFSSKLIDHLSQQSGIKKICISSCHPKVNGNLEFSHRFIKVCIWKFSIEGTLEWNQLLPCATTAFTWFPNMHS